MGKLFDPEDKKNKPILDYFESKTCLIVHSSSSIRNAIKRTMVQFGIKGTNVLDCATMTEAKNVIATKLPNYVITNRTIQDVNAMPLFDAHLQVIPNRIHGGFFVITEEKTVSEVGWALAYEMDGMIVLPLNATNLFNTFFKAISRKVNSTPYLDKIEEGRVHYLQGDLSVALNIFKESLALDKTPFESLSFIGQIQFEQNSVAEAIESYEESIKHNSQYFKSLKNLNQIYADLKNYKKCYEINVLMAQNYPTAPERIPELIRLSIVNQKYEDIDNYYKFFQTITNPNLQLQHYLAAGFAILGKYFAKTNDTKKGVEALKSAYQYSNGKYEILKSIAQSLQALKKLEVLLDLFDINDKAELSFRAKEIYVIQFQALQDSCSDDSSVVMLGEKYLKHNVIDVAIYTGIIERSIKLERDKWYIEGMILAAGRHYPEKIEEFEYKLICMLDPNMLKKPQKKT